MDCTTQLGMLRERRQRGQALLAGQRVVLCSPSWPLLVSQSTALQGGADVVAACTTEAEAEKHVLLGFCFGGAGRHHIGAPLQRGGLADQQRPAWAAQHHPLAGEQGLPPLAPLPQHPQLGGAVHGRRASDLLVGEMDCGVVSQ